MALLSLCFVLAALLFCFVTRSLQNEFSRRREYLQKSPSQNGGAHGLIDVRGERADIAPH